MATSNTNSTYYGAISQEGFKKIQMPCTDSVSSVNQGDLLYFDGTAKIVKPLTDANAASFCGQALQPSKPSSNLDNSGALAQQALMVGGAGLVCLLKTTAAETYSYGTAVYVGADAQTITTVDPGSHVVIGHVILPIGAAAATVTGAVGVSVQVLLSPAILLN